MALSLTAKNHDSRAGAVADDRTEDQRQIELYAQEEVQGQRNEAECLPPKIAIRITLLPHFSVEQVRTRRRSGRR